MESKSDTAIELFHSGFNCSQSVFAVFSEKYGMPQETALKLACGFGGGMRCGEVCGAVSGAVLVIGLRYGQAKADDKEAKSKCYAETETFTTRFRSQNSSILCHDLLGCNISTAQGREQAQRENLFQTVCVDAIRSSVALLEAMGY